MRIGYGYDVHRFQEGGPLVLGGVEIPFEKSLSGHSDSDVLLHAIIDAMLGACALGDIGQHFPDTSDEFRNIDSRILLQKVIRLVEEQGFKVGNVDATIVAERPTLSPHITAMRKLLSEDLKADINQISVKATTSERLGFEGAQKGISARAVILLVER